MPRPVAARRAHVKGTEVSVPLENPYERGRGGGIRLARPASQIRVGEVLRRVEPGFLPAECFDPENNLCRITERCRLRHVFGEALDAWFAVLERYTLADLVRRRRILSLLEASQ